MSILSSLANKAISKSLKPSIDPEDSGNSRKKAIFASMAKKGLGGVKKTSRTKLLSLQD